MFQLILTPMAAALIILAINAYFGLHVIRRGVIFVDLAFAQVAALGATVGLLMGFDPTSVLGFGFTFLFTLIGALIFSFTRMESSIVPQEAIIGITYVVASAAVILLTSFTPEGAEHVSETLTGSLIWVTWSDVARIAIAYALIGLLHLALRGPFFDTTFHPGRRRHVRAWDFLFYTTFGVAITFSVNIAGVLLIFSTLVIPAAVAFLFTPHFGRALLLAWLSGGIAVVGGLLASFYWDVTTGPLLVCAFGLVMIVAALLRPLIGVKAVARRRADDGVAAAEVGAGL